MAISSKKRKSLPKSQFGLPGSKKYPVDTRKRAANAKGRAKQQMNKGNLSRSSYNKVISAANRRLKKKS